MSPTQILRTLFYNSKIENKLESSIYEKVNKKVNKLFWIDIFMNYVKKQFKLVEAPMYISDYYYFIKTIEKDVVECTMTNSWRACQIGLPAFEHPLNDR